MNRTFKIGVFEDEEKLISSLKLLQGEKYLIYDVFTPYPVHEVFHLLKRRSRLPTAAYFFGLFGAAATLAFLYYTSVIDWPLVYGGKPFNSFPSFIVVTIVLTIFTVTIASLGAFSASSRLFPGRDNTIFDHRATDDKFVIVVDTKTVNQSEAARLEEIMKHNGAVEVVDKVYESVRA